MHWNRWFSLALLLFLTACASRRGGESSQSYPGSDSRGSDSPSNGAIVTPANSWIGRVVSVNPSARYVVVTYSVGQLPVRDSRLFAYRNGLKVAELKVTEFSRDINAVADITAGECQIGDEVRDH